MKLKLFFFNITVLFFILSCVSLPEGFSIKSEVYNADNVKFFHDLNYEKDGKRVFERKIWNEVFLNINDYPYLKKQAKVLQDCTEPQKVIDAIISVLETIKAIF